MYIDNIQMPDGNVYKLRTKTSELENDSGFLTGSLDDIYTKDNLVGGTDIELAKEVVGNGQIDNDTILMLHLDDNFEDSSFYKEQHTWENKPAEGELLYVDGKFGKGIANYLSFSGFSPQVINESLFDNIHEVTVDFTTFCSALVTDPSQITINFTNGSQIGARMYYYRGIVFDFYVNGTNYTSQMDISDIALEQYVQISYEMSEGKAVVYGNGKPYLTLEDPAISTGTGISSIQILPATSNNNNLCSLDEVRVSKCLRYNGQPFEIPTEPYSATTETGRTLVNYIGDNPEGVYTRENLIGGRGISIEEEIQGAGQIDSDTILMLHLDGNFEDSSEYASSNVINTISGTEVFTEAKFNQGWKYGGSSSYSSKYYTNDSLFSGIDKVTVDYITLAGSSVTTPSYIRLNTLSTGITSSAYIYVYGTNTITAYVNGTSYNISLTEEEIGQYPLVSYEASEGKVVFFINGKVVKVVEDPSFTFGTGVQNFQISVANNETSLLDEIRISKTLRYNGEDFTPLTQPYGPTIKTGRSLINNTVGKNIGEVFYSQSNSSSDNIGALPLFTGETITNADVLYPEFFSWVSSHSELQTTAEEYENVLATYGECPKYVVSNDSLRLPKLTNYIKMANNTDGITQSLEGLPDHTHKTYYKLETSGDTNAQPCWRNEQQVQTGPASESNPIYGRSEHVTPAHTTLYPWVQAYNYAVPASSAQAAEFQSALSGKADNNLGNIPANYDYVYRTFNQEAGTTAAASWWRIYRSGWIEQGGTTGNAANTETITFAQPFARVPFIYCFCIASDNYVKGVNVTSASATSFTFKKTTEGGSSINNRINWFACGQGA